MCLYVDQAKTARRLRERKDVWGWKVVTLTGVKVNAAATTEKGKVVELKGETSTRGAKFRGMKFEVRGRGKRTLRGKVRRGKVTRIYGGAIHFFTKRPQRGWETGVVIPVRCRAKNLVALGWDDACGYEVEIVRGPSLDRVIRQHLRERAR